MDTLTNNWFTMAVVSVFIVAFKAQVMNTIIGFICYFTRTFDKDGDPDTPEKGQLLNGAKGDFGDVTVLKYDFPLKFGAGVKVEYPDGGIEPIRYPVWYEIRKREPPPRKKGLPIIKSKR